MAPKVYPPDQNHERWIHEEQSGYAGLRCSKCQTWVYAHEPQWCECNVHIKAEIEALAEFVEVVTMVLHTDADVKLESAMYYLRHTQAHNPKGFAVAFPKFKEHVRQLQLVVEHYETGRIPEVKDGK